MRFFGSLLFLASFACASPAEVHGDQHELSVNLEKVVGTNTEFKATVTNNGKTDVQILKSGSIFDSRLIRKAWVSRPDGTSVEFKGMTLSVNSDVPLDENSFQHIASGGRFDVIFDLAKVYNLSGGGKFVVDAHGVFFFFEGQSTISRQVSYNSPSIEVEIDGELAAKAANANEPRNEARSVSSFAHCTPKQNAMLARAINDCVTLANAGSAGAQSSDSDRLEMYFKNSSPFVRNHISTVFEEAQQLCDVTTSEKGYRAICRTDYCGNDIIGKEIAYCPSFFEPRGYIYGGLTDTAKICFKPSRAHFVLKNAVSLTGRAKGKVVEHHEIIKLPMEHARDNPANYASFATSAKLQCVRELSWKWAWQTASEAFY
ncbi:hypothetical protein RJ55_01838 [Drechmeria coniospora]|nr:hypothetical protein RJ55_01838 [Drechmeria coniospora]